MNKLTQLLDNNKIAYSFNEPMSAHTTFKIGGNAQIFIMPENTSELSAVVSLCASENIDYMVVGKGSNLLVSDSGINGAVINLGGEFNKLSLIDETTITAGAGQSLASLCKFALENELTGLEFAYGIPGSVGGAVYMNAGAYDGQMSDVVCETEHIDKNGKIGSFDASALNFGYRKSAYTPGGYVITSAVFKLQKGDKTEISKRMNELFARRKEKQPLEYPSAGSVFKRPEGYFAGALIEQSGLKGKTIGGAQISEKHAGFIINIGGATSEDVKKLIAFCQDTVFEKFAVKLEPEIKMI
ncbi:MAG: UDP-N-acetylmuramate dehydrogenase [Acutalibacteraceae bacterium]